MRVLWRISVIVCGLLYSATLWHQQTLADIQSNQQIQDAVTRAVTDANKHSDTQFQAVQQNVGGVDKKVTAVGTALSQTSTALSGDIQRTADAIQKTSDRLDASIGKVGKPDPPELAKLRFSLIEKGGTLPEPVESMTVPLAADGTATYTFVVRNTSGVQAEGVDIWVTICDECKWAEEPSGFESLQPGANDHQRHRSIGNINPGVAFGVITIRIKPPANAPMVWEGFTGSCKNCGEIQPLKPFSIFLGLPSTPQ